MHQALMMLEMNLNKVFIDLNSTLAVDLPKKYYSCAALICWKPLFPSMPGETSGPPPKRRSSKRSQDLPAGSTMEERVVSGILASLQGKQTSFSSN
ncbi:hypothetical protein FCM35_KLT02455 [Carex littledalei]|uniref:Uncharacterized protein n=1 Tax=Carex littledalei TaxID=544730 RepID=A0A833VS25_9POAL|nr:hypothetical protein FCM35_KLT02455 [Carex littledalei]